MSPTPTLDTSSRTPTQAGWPLAGAASMLVAETGAAATGEEVVEEEEEEGEEEVAKARGARQSS